MRVTVLPLAVTDVVGLLFEVLVLGRVVGRADVVGLDVVGFGAAAAGAGAVELAGTSVSAGTVAVSRFAS